jgi:hypothetical protein
MMVGKCGGRGEGKQEIRGEARKISLIPDPDGMSPG